MMKTISLVIFLCISGCLTKQIVAFSYCGLQQHRCVQQLHNQQQNKHLIKELAYRTTTNGQHRTSILPGSCHTEQKCLTTVLSATKQSKGFSKSTTNNNKSIEKSKENVITTTTTTTTAAKETQTVSVSVRQQQQEEQRKVEPINAGQAALEKMRRERAEAKDAELRKVREMLQADEQIRKRPGDDTKATTTKSTAAAIPEKVAIRMGQRMIPFVGIPLFLGLGTFVGFWYMATYRGLEYQPVLVAASTIILLFIGLLGITYSVMSTSWDEEVVDTTKEDDNTNSCGSTSSSGGGGVFGINEFQKNIKNIQDGFNRSKENAILREKLSGLSTEEVQKALKDLEIREEKQKQKVQQQSLQNKIQNELE